MMMSIETTKKQIRDYNKDAQPTIQPVLRTLSFHSVSYQEKTDVTPFVLQFTLPKVRPQVSESVARSLNENADIWKQLS